MPDSLELTDLAYRYNPAKPVNSFNLQECLINATPMEGWGVTVAIKGVPSRIEGEMPLIVVANLAERLTNNGIKFEQIDLWCNLNVTWMGRVNAKHHKVKLTNMLSLFTAVEVKTFKGAHTLKHPPEAWIGAYWDTLEAQLCMDSYVWSRFYKGFMLFVMMLDQDTNTTLANAGLFKKLYLHGVHLQNNPRYSRDAAREWLTQTRSDVMGTPHTPSKLWSN